jgi:hypothetical protein
VKTLYRWWASLLLVMIILQVGFAGYGAFYTAHRIDKSGTVPKTVTEHGFEHGFLPHATFGYFVVLAGLIFLVIGAIAGIGKWRLGRHGLIGGLLIVQVLLAWIGFAVPAVGFFHPVNALVIFALTGSVAYSTWREAKLAQQAAPAAEPVATT